MSSVAIWRAMRFRASKLLAMAAIFAVYLLAVGVDVIHVSPVLLAASARARQLAFTAACMAQGWISSQRVVQINKAHHALVMLHESPEKASGA